MIDPGTEAVIREQDVNPWSVSGGKNEKGEAIAIDYEAISRKWNTKLIDDELLERFERITGHKPHRWLRRGLFFSHRDFDKILDHHEKGEPFLLYTGRGPSTGSLHIGHAIPMMFTEWLQDVFDVPLVFMLTDDEKAIFNRISFSETEKMGLNNAKDVIALGFDERKTFIYLSSQYDPPHHFKRNTLELGALMTNNQVRGAFGFDGSTNTACNAYPARQCAAALATSYPEIWSEPPLSDRTAEITKIPCLIPMGIDQDPYFRLLRENASRMEFKAPKPALIHSKFLTALQGAGGKMSSSNPDSAIFMTDTAKQIKNKINKHAFSGGQETVEEHRRLGGNPDVDVAYIYLTYFLEDDKQLEKIYNDYKKGDLLTGELKKMAIDEVQKFVSNFQKSRELVTDEVRDRYMEPRKLVYGTNGQAASGQELASSIANMGVSK